MNYPTYHPVVHPDAAVGVPTAAYEDDDGDDDDGDDYDDDDDGSDDGDYGDTGGITIKMMTQ